jgi:hypothetical protein
MLSSACCCDQLGALPWATFTKGLIVGSAVMLGWYAATNLVITSGSTFWR